MLLKCYITQCPQQNSDRNPSRVSAYSHMQSVVLGSTSVNAKWGLAHPSNISQAFKKNFPNKPCKYKASESWVKTQELFLSKEIFSKRQEMFMIWRETRGYNKPFNATGIWSKRVRVSLIESHTSPVQLTSAVHITQSAAGSVQEDSSRVS